MKERERERKRETERQTEKGRDREKYIYMETVYSYYFKVLLKLNKLKTAAKDTRGSRNIKKAWLLKNINLDYIVYLYIYIYIHMELNKKNHCT